MKTDGRPIVARAADDPGRAPGEGGRALATQTKEACIVWLEFQSDSLDERGWLLPLGRVSLLAACIEQLREVCPWPMLLVAPESTPRSARALVESCKVPVYWSKSRGNSFAVARASLEHDLRQVLIVHGLLGLPGMFPGTFLDSLVQEHNRSGALVTTLDGLPEPISAHVCARSILELLASVPADPAVADDPASVIERIGRAFSVNPRVVIGHLAATGCSSLEPADLPSRIPWLSRPDVQRLARAIEDPSSASPSARLRRLRELLTEEDHAQHRTARRKGRRRKRSRTRILYASAPSAYSGAEQCLLNSIAGVGEYDVDVHALVASEGLFANRLREAGVAVHCPQFDFSAPTVRNAIWCSDLVESVRPDLIHCNAVVGAPLLAASRCRDIPLLQWVRFAHLRGFEEHLVSADRITAVSRFIGRLSAQQMIRSDKIRVVYDGVDIRQLAQRASSAPGREQLGFTPTDFLILCIARFVRYKRHDVLARAVSKVAARHPNVRLVLIGEADKTDPSYEECLGLLHAIGLISRTTVLGFQHDVVPYELAADAVVLCSEGEPLGTAVLESMALGRAIIVTDSGGLPEMIEHDVSGLLCPPGDPDSLASRICALIESPATRQRLGAAACAEVQKRFSVEANARALMSVYCELM